VLSRIENETRTRSTVVREVSKDDGEPQQEHDENYHVLGI
jgi:hypothetical protein